MSNDHYIEFKKQRELGEILSDTFGFLRTQFKPFFNTFFKIVGPYLLVMIISLGFYFYSFRGVLAFNLESSNDAFSVILMVISGFALFISAIAAYVMSQSTVLHYIKSYTEGKGIIEFSDIKKNVYDSFWNFIGLGFLVGISIMGGFLVCFFPGIYLYVPLMLTFSIMVFSQKGVGDAYQYSFTLIKDNWWITFASLFVIGIIVTVAGYAFNLPASIYGWVKMGVFSGQVDGANIEGYFLDPIYILLNLIGSLVQFLLNLITVIAGVLIYFNLNERKNFTGTFEKIGTLGQTEE
ncbi:MAG: hypothetical protein COA50_14340 [Flavobacteriaceae bacterium]|nr:MAG: hypothetical protein COA50_14340 [Flavobacteriaceae bacterium]